MIDPSSSEDDGDNDNPVVITAPQKPPAKSRRPIVAKSGPGPLPKVPVVSASITDAQPNAEILAKGAAQKVQQQQQQQQQQQHDIGANDKNAENSVGTAAHNGFGKQHPQQQQQQSQQQSQQHKSQQQNNNNNEHHLSTSAASENNTSTSLEVPHNSLPSGASQETLNQSVASSSRANSLPRAHSPSPSINSDTRTGGGGSGERDESDHHHITNNTGGGSGRGEEDRKRRIQLYVFVSRCISYPFNAKQPTDLTKKQLKVTKQQLDAICQRFQVKKI